MPLGEAEGVDDFQHTGQTKTPPTITPEEKEQPALDDHCPLDSGRPAALHSDQPPVKTRISAYPRSWMTLANSRLVRSLRLRNKQPGFEPREKRAAEMIPSRPGYPGAFQLVQRNGPERRGCARPKIPPGCGCR